MNSPTRLPALPARLALIVVLLFHPMIGRADVAPPVEVTPERAAALAEVLRVVVEPTKGQPGLLRVVVSGPLDAGVVVTVRLIVGTAGGRLLRSDLAVTTQDLPNADGNGKPTRSWYAEFEADAGTARDSRLTLFLAETKGPPRGSEYVIPVKHFVEQ